MFEIVDDDILRTSSGELKSKISINFSVFAHISKNLQMESNTFRPMIMNYTQLAYEATMYFECQTFWKVSDVKLHYHVSYYINSI